MHSYRGNMHRPLEGEKAGSYCFHMHIQCKYLHVCMYLELTEQ